MTERQFRLSNRAISYTIFKYIEDDANIYMTIEEILDKLNELYYENEELSLKNRELSIENTQLKEENDTLTLRELTESKYYNKYYKLKKEQDAEIKTCKEYLKDIIDEKIKEVVSEHKYGDVPFELTKFAHDVLYDLKMGLE